MQTHPPFIFHLDEPIDQPARGGVPLRGWVVAQQPIDSVLLAGNAARTLAAEERPDVRIAFPAFPFVAGFRGSVSSRDLIEGALHFSFGLDRSAIEPLPLPPAQPPFVSRMWMHLLRVLQLVRSRASRDTRGRWNAALKAFLLEAQIRRSGHLRRVEIDQILALFADHLPDAVVVQIGANDGATGDPLGRLFARTRWTGMLVEPVPFVCSELVRRYRGRDGVHVEQVAIADADGDAPIYRLRTKPGETPGWFDQLATLDRNVLLKHRSSIPEIESLIIEERTPTARLETLLLRHAFERIDLLVIDTEGYDFQILRQLDFGRFQPLLILFEHQHLSSDDKALAYHLLRTNRYAFAETAEGDSLAWR